jgi:hypothetical protein
MNLFGYGRAEVFCIHLPELWTNLIATGPVAWQWQDLVSDEAN